MCLFCKENRLGKDFIRVTMKKRDISIDWLKLLAVLFIINSHLAPLYGEYASLARGGVFGVALFFFCSGYTLFLKPLEGIGKFPNWYKRRISRIYPALLIFSFITCTFFGRMQTINQIFFTHGYWFINCIMIYYVIIYFIGSYLKDRLRLVVLVYLLFVAACFFHEYQKPGFFMYVDPFQRIPFFMLMLMGAIVGLSHDKIKTSPILDVIMAVVCFIGYYVLLYFSMNYENLDFVEFFSYFTLLGFVYYLYKAFSSNWARHIYNSRIGQPIIRFVGGLCLEIYIVQFYFITDKFNDYFPLNFLIVFLVIILVAYILRCLSRLLLQTLSDAPYDWRKIVSAY